MIPYFEVKKALASIIRCEHEIDDSCDILGVISSSVTNRQEIECTISNEELIALYNSISEMKSRDIVFQKSPSNQYELAVEYFGPIRDEIVTIDDNFDGIQYELSQITKEYSLFLFLLLLENKELIDVRRWFSRFRHRLARVARTPGLNSCRELDILMPALFDCLSIKIETQRGMGFDKFQKLSTSFIFEFAYSTAIAVRDYKNIEDFFAIPRLNTLRRGRAKVEKAPHRIYSTEIVDMYTRAISSRDPYIKFISFYQIMEYFYDQVFKIKLVSIVKNKLTHPEFSYRKESKIFDVIKTIKKELKTVSVDGWGNEIKSLELVLEYYVKPDELLDRIDKLDRQAKDFYINNNVAFCSAAKINFDDTANIFKAIAKRIYKTRNALVHSKEEYISERYIQYKHEQILKNEITLVQAIAESVIINSADEMRD